MSAPISLTFNTLTLPPCDIALSLTPSQVVIASTPSIYDFQSQHVVVEASNGSIIHKVSTFVKNESIFNKLENGTIDNPMLIFAFEFVKNVRELEQHNLILYVFVIFYV